MSDEVKVSVICAAYNHSKYIRRALDGFVMQKTNFEFEVLVHDDASTDDTAEIIREYAAKYDCIKPIYQTENQYSKSVNIGRKFIYPRVTGKYIAFCEGDDYWTDENKLQRQVDYMDAHPDCSMCCHAYNTVRANDETLVECVNTLQREGTITPEEAIYYRRPSQLATQMFQSDVILAMPDFFFRVGVGDYPMLLHAAHCGELHYFEENMADHRVLSDESWTVRVYNNPELQLRHWERIKNFLNEYDAYCEYAYHHAVVGKVDEIDYTCALVRNDYRRAVKYQAFKNASIARKATVYLGCVFPELAKKIEKLHHKG